MFGVGHLRLDDRAGRRIAVAVTLIGEEADVVTLGANDNDLDDRAGQRIEGLPLPSPLSGKKRVQRRFEQLTKTNLIFSG